jgi:cysteine desulfurase
MRSLRDRLHQGLRETLGNEVALNGHPEKRLPNTLSLAFRGLAANRILEEIGLDIAASPGAACHSDQVAISHVLQAMGIAPEWAMGTLRFSLGRMTTAAEIDRALEVIPAALRKLRG